MPLAEFLGSQPTRRELLKGVMQGAARLSPLLLPGVPAAVMASVCTDGSGRNSGHLDRGSEQTGERDVIAYPSYARPSAEIIRKIVAYVPEGVKREQETVPIILFRADPRISKIIAQHVKKIMQAGYADNLNDQDFFHGHLHVNDPSVCHYEKDTPVQVTPWGAMGRYPRNDLPKGLTYDQWVEKFLQADPYFVYHTREHITGQPDPYISEGRLKFPDTNYSGPPRSIIGTMNMQIYPMKSDISPEYVKYGSVSATEIFEYDGKTSQGMCEVQPDSARISAGGRLHSARQTFNILSDTNGRYKLGNGEKFDVYHQLY